MVAGYSGKPLPEKLGIRSAMTLALLDPPAGIEGILWPLPDGVVTSSTLDGHRDVVLAFFTERVRLADRVPALIRSIAPAGMVWVAWPKRASRMATDITEDVIREVALPAGLVDVKVCAVDEVWSGLKLVIRKALR